MVNQYEQELNLLNMRQEIKNFTADSLALASLPQEAVKTFPSLEALVTAETIVMISDESAFTSIAGNILKFLKTVLKTIYRFIRNIFATQAGDVDKSIKTAKRKIKDAVGNLDAWIGSSLISSKEGFTEIINNMMLFKILGNDKFDYLKWLATSNHLEDSSTFMGSYENAITFINEDGIQKYRELYYGLRQMDGINVIGKAPSINELAYPIAIHKDRISFIVMNLYPSGTTVAVSKVRDVHLELNFTDEAIQIKNSDGLNRILSNIINRLDGIVEVKGLATDTSVSDEDIVTAMDKIAFYYMRDASDKKTQKAIAGFLATLSDGCSLALTNHLRNLESVGKVMNEIINYERL